MKRRSVLGLLSTAVAMTALGGSKCNAQADDEVEEFQASDVDVADETLRFSRSDVSEVVSGSARAFFEPYFPQFGTELLSVAGSMVGNSRRDTPDEIDDYLRLFGLRIRDSGGNFVPYCAAGLSFAAAVSYANLLGSKLDAGRRVELARQLLPDIDHWYFYSSPSVIDMYKVADGQRRWRARGEPKPGWLVVFRFKREADHIGIVKSVSPDALATIEFNTTRTHGGSQQDGGVVAERQRPIDRSILGYIITDGPPRL